MSNYISVMLNPKTGLMQEAGYIDNLFGKHKYGVAFPKDGSGYDFDIVYSTEELDFFTADEVQKYLDENLVGRTRITPYQLKQSAERQRKKWRETLDELGGVD